MTNHKNESELAARAAANFQATENQRLVAATRAQAHATLYLAEQQRIANLIALYSLPEDDAADLVTHGVIYSQVAVDIIESLGLGE